MGVAGGVVALDDPAGVEAEPEGAVVGSAGDCGRSQASNATTSPINAMTAPRTVATPDQRCHGPDDDGSAAPAGVCCKDEDTFGHL